jgi:PAS domain S-box-containing protein
MSEASSNLEHMIEQLSRRVDKLGKRVDTEPEAAELLVAEALSELSVSLEELHVASEELGQQASELEEAAEQLAAERLKYAELFEFAPDGYLVTDTSGMITEANRNAILMLGDPPGGVVGKPLAAVLGPGTRREIFRVLRELENGAEVVETETQIKVRGGGDFWVSMRASRSLGLESLQPALRWIIRDVSERVAALTSLTEANQFKEAFLLAVSHDLQSPVAAIAGFVDGLRDSFPSLSEERVRSILDSVSRSISNVKSVIANLSDVDRLGRESVQVLRRPTDVPELVRRASSDLGISERVKTEHPPDLSEVALDPGLTERILSNLLSNAVRYSPPYTDITVHIARHDGGVMLVVEDAGPGVTKESRVAVFELFHRSSDVGSGVGVGLYLTRAFAQLHGGDAWMDESPTGGAAVHVLLPA